MEGNEVLGHGHIEGPKWIMWVAVFVSAGGILLAYLMYARRNISKGWLAREGAIPHNLLSNKYYMDELYSYSIIPFTKGISLFLSFIDRFIVEGIMHAIRGLVIMLGKIGSKLQNGQIQQYGTVVVAGLALLLVIYALTGGLL